MALMRSFDFERQKHTHKEKCFAEENWFTWKLLYFPKNEIDTNEVFGVMELCNVPFLLKYHLMWLVIPKVP